MGMDFCPPFFQVGADQVRLLRDGAEAYPALLEAIEAARREILLEMYWFGADATGRRFRDALAAKAQAGVVVRVVHDSIGSLSAGPAFWGPLLAAGGDVHEFNPIAPWQRRFRLDRLNFRNHRKLLVVDGEIGFCGGINIGDPWAPVADGGSGWRDDMLEVRGPAAQELRTVFRRTWKKVGHSDPEGSGHLARRPTSPVYVVGTGLRRRGGRGLPLFLRRSVGRSQNRILIANPYFLPSPSLGWALVRAVRRGVLVRVLVPQDNDVKIVELAMEWLLAHLAEKGLQVFRFGSRMLHAKTLVFDGRWVTSGSYNLDTRSWRFNLECNLVVEDPAFAAFVEQSLQEDFARGEPFDLRVWATFPWWRRALGWFLARFRHWL